MGSLKKKIFFQLLCGLLFLEIATIALIVSKTYLTAERNSNAIFRSNRNSLLIGDYRQAKRSIRAGALASGTQVQYQLTESITVFDLFFDNKSILELPITFTYSVNLSDEQKGNKFPRLVFTHNLLFNLNILLASILLTALAYILLSIYFYRTLSSHYRKKIEFEKKIKMAEISQQVAHDIKSPLGFLNVFSDKFGNELGEKSKLLNRAITRIHEIVNDLENNENHNQQFDLIALTKEIIQEKEIEVEKSKQLSLKLTSTIGNALIEFEENSLRRILSNLINNSIEASNNSPTIEISIKQNSKQIQLKIMDEGNGMRPSDLKSAFNRGYTTKGSSGLGLYHAKQKMESQGGHLELDSTINRGTTVTLTFPTTNQK